ncbi:MAG TPA: peptidyl-prolyl cis-trans isomerase [Terracidiphilus sp.]|jgi:peptidyl-prolyl cis-trans isomerase D|nr:peptidyl-prolyl cis-trans isomerase [Terracidiphilus sp.]
MIRFLQTETKMKKAIFIVIIAAASVGMVVYLIPGLMSGATSAPDTYAEVYPHWYSKFFHAADVVSLQKVEQTARQQISQRSPQYLDNPVILNYFTQQVGQQLVQEQILVTEAAKLGISANNDDVVKYLHTGPTGEALFPNGKFIGEAAYTNIVNSRLNMSVPDFEEGVRRQIVINRLQDYITAGVSVSDQEVRDTYRKQNIKIKFEYAVLSGDDLRKTINPSDTELQSFFTKNAARYAHGVPEQRTIAYFGFTPNQLPGGIPQPSQQAIQSYYNQHQSEYQVPEQARSRHVLIKVDAGADAKTDAAAKAKAEDIANQLRKGGNWTDLAKKDSDDPGSKDSGGELGFSQRGRMVPEFDNAIFTQKIGDISVVKSQFGYHVIQVEERQPAHSQSLAEVSDTIKATLSRQLISQAEENYARQLTQEAEQKGLQATAAAHHLDLVTTPPVAAAGGTIAALPDGSQVISKAFQMAKGDKPQYAPTGEGYAVLQVVGIAPAHSPSFADWKDHVLDDFRNQQLPGLLNAKTQQLADKAKATGDLAKAAKEVGASVKTSDLVGQSAQVPDFGAVGQLAPQLFDMSAGAISGPINAGRTGVVAKIDDKQEPTPQEIQKNLDQTRESILSERRNEAFEIFASSVANDYKKRNLIRYNPKAITPESGE